MILLLGSLVACMAPDALSDDEDVLPAPALDDTEGMGDSGGATSAGGSFVGWIAGSQPTDADAADGALRALRLDGDSVLCQHTGLVAVCGTLSDPGATVTEAGVTVDYALTTDPADGLCAYTASYVVYGVGEGPGTVTATLSVDGGASRALDVSATYEGALVPIE